MKSDHIRISCDNEVPLANYFCQFINGACGVEGGYGGLQKVPKINHRIGHELHRVMINAVVFEPQL